jgi:dephospho-CoA kinase
VLRIGLTGGIGSGKSTVSALLAARGAVIIDADRIAREVVEPGTPGLARVVERFGAGVLTPDGALDRAALGAIVFADEAARRDLEGILHPLISAEAGRRAAAAPPDAVVVHEIPLLVEAADAAASRDHDVVVVVEAPLDVRIRRLAERGVTSHDARARIAAQATDEERRAVADHVLDNGGDRADLERQVDALWAALRLRAVGSGSPS